MNLNNKIVVVTGASRGLGKEIAVLLRGSGCVVIGVSRDKEDLKEVCDDCYSCDLDNKKQIDEFIVDISQKYKNIDILINNAGIGVYKKFEELKMSDWDKSLNINLNSVFYLTKKMLPFLKKSDEGLVINIGSGAGVIPMAERTAYCTSKFALRGLTLSLFEEYKGTKINFGLMTLGSILTSFGTMSIQEKKIKQKTGEHSYFSPRFVSEKIKELIEDDYFSEEAEFVMYPPSYEK